LACASGLYFSTHHAFACQVNRSHHCWLELTLWLVLEM
jgi:hypothetical protein